MPRVSLPLKRLVIALLSIVLGCVGCVPSPDARGYRAEIEAWRAERIASLKGPDGYLNLVGLFWFTAETSAIGSATDSDVVLPARAAARVGVLRLTDTGVVFDAEPGVETLYEGVPVRSILMSDDTTDYPVTLTHGSLAWTVIRRDDRYALRLRDYEHPAIEAFGALEYFPIDPAYRVEAWLKPYTEPKITRVKTVIEGLDWRPESPGVLEFELEAETYALEAYASGDELFLVFGDQTSGRETYPAGRFLYAPMPSAAGRTVLDFNRAYNPPCAFNEFSTCPVASPRNRLPARIEAGEKFDSRVGFSPESN